MNYDPHESHFNDTIGGTMNELDEDLRIRYGLEKTSIRNDRIKFRTKNLISRKTFESLPPAEDIAVRNLAERKVFQERLARRPRNILDTDTTIRVDVRVQNTFEFYEKDGVLKARAVDRKSVV